MTQLITSDTSDNTIINDEEIIDLTDSNTMCPHSVSMSSMQSDTNRDIMVQQINGYIKSHNTDTVQHVDVVHVSRRKPFTSHGIKRAIIDTDDVTILKTTYTYTCEHKCGCLHQKTSTYRSKTMQDKHLHQTNPLLHRNCTDPNKYPCYYLLQHVPTRSEKQLYHSDENVQVQKKAKVLTISSDDSLLSDNLTTSVDYDADNDMNDNISVHAPILKPLSYNDRIKQPDWNEAVVHTSTKQPTSVWRKPPTSTDEWIEWVTALDTTSLNTLNSVLNIKCASPIKPITDPSAKTSKHLEILKLRQSPEDLQRLRHERQKHGCVVQPVGWPDGVEFGNTLRWTQYGNKSKNIAAIYNCAVDKIRREAALGIPLFYIKESTVPGLGLGVFANVHIYAGTKQLIYYSGVAYIVNDKRRKPNPSAYISKLVSRLGVPTDMVPSTLHTVDSEDELGHEHTIVSIEIDAEIYGNESRFINCCYNTGKKQNVTFSNSIDPHTGEPRLSVDAIRDIKPNEELFLDYGRDYWLNKNATKQYTQTATKHVAKHRVTAVKSARDTQS